MKILITTLLALFISSNASAEMRYKELGNEWVVDNSRVTFGYTTSCIDGYKWVSVIHNKRGTDAAMSMAFEQFYIEKNGRAVPAKC